MRSNSPHTGVSDVVKESSMFNVKVLHNAYVYQVQLACLVHFSVYTSNCLFVEMDIPSLTWCVVYSELCELM